MAIPFNNTTSGFPNPQLLNGMHFRSPMNFKDLMVHKDDIELLIQKYRDA